MQDRQSSYATAKTAETEHQKRKTQAPADACPKRQKSEEAKPAETEREKRIELEQLQIAEAESKGFASSHAASGRMGANQRAQPGKAWAETGTLERLVVTRH